jgi:hypothetical protein
VPTAPVPASRVVGASLPCRQPPRRARTALTTRARVVASRIIQADPELGRKFSTLQEKGVFGPPPGGGGGGGGPDPNQPTPGAAFDFDQDGKLDPNEFVSMIFRTKPDAKDMTKEELVELFQSVDTGELLLRVHWVAVPKALRARRANRSLGRREREGVRRLGGQAAGGEEQGVREDRLQGARRVHGAADRRAQGLQPGRRGEGAQRAGATGRGLVHVRLARCGRGRLSGMCVRHTRCCDVTTSALSPRLAGR